MTFCILPWINFGTNTTGRPRVCGYSEHKSPTLLKDSSITVEWNNDYFKNIRKEFLAETWPENCRRCKQVEELGGVSKRIEENIHWHPQYKHLVESTNNDGSVSYAPPHIDVRTGTTCNLKCIHCGTGASSKWSEDKLLANKYPNTKVIVIDNKWISQEGKFWNELRSVMHQVNRYNFLGGESFANKQHNLFLKDLSNAEHSKNVKVAYTTNALLITQEHLKYLDSFKFVSLRISIDAVNNAGEYFRYPLKWNKFVDQVNMISQFVKNKENFEVNFQWTASNISMFYLVETYETMKNMFPDIKFIFCNHVDSPKHMSPQNLPVDIKKLIIKKINDYKFIESDNEFIPFYINYMLEDNLWDEHQDMLYQYFIDLDTVRKTNWEYSFKEMDLKKYAK